jgi:hypothetical protein
LSTIAISGAGVNTVVAGDNMAIRVVGKKDSRRVTLYVASEGGAGTITVGNASALTIKILDGSANDALIPAAAGNSRVVTDTNKLSYGTVAGGALTGGIDIVPPVDFAANTGAKFKLFGQHTGDTMPALVLAVTKNEFIGVLGGVVPHAENTLCVSAEKAVGNLFVSFASKNDKFTFSGDSQIAHTGSALAITLKSCVPAKSSINDQIKIGEQGKCFFDYETAGGTLLPYCPSHAASNVYLESGTLFGDLGDLYDIVWESKTSGVYFTGVPAIKGLKDTQTVCATPPVGATVTPAQTDFCAGTKCSVAGDDVALLTTTPCTIETKNQVNKVMTYGGAITGVHTYKYLVFDFDQFVYDKSVVKSGTEVDIQVTLQKYPCGQIFTGTIAIGTFVTDCTTSSTGSDTLLFPYLIGTKYAGWFSAFIITNGSSAAGTATLTAVDENGNTATYTTPSIGALRHFNSSVLKASDWTNATTNTANFDMSSSYALKVLCNFDNGAGVAYEGNLNTGSTIGYTAKGTDWNN